MDFEELLKRITPTLKKITYKLNGHFTFFNDEDLFQEALIHLWEDFQAGKLNDKTDSYILQGCYFHLKNYLRKVRIKAKFVCLDALVKDETQDLEGILLLPDEPPRDYCDILNDKLLVETIQNNGLTPREKDVVLLCMEGLTTREIGTRLGISHVRVVKLMGRIKDKCRKYRGGC